MQQAKTISIQEANENQFSEIWHIFQDVIKDADSYPYLPETSFEEA